MTKIEEQALKVAKAWRRYTEIDRRISADMEPNPVGRPRRSPEERQQDARDVRPACAAYKQELETLTRMVL